MLMTLDIILNQVLISLTPIYRMTVSIKAMHNEPLIVPLSGFINSKPMQLLEYRTQLLGVCKSGVCASKQVPVQMALSLALCVAFSVP